MSEYLNPPRIFWDQLRLAQDGQRFFFETGTILYLTEAIAAWQRILNHPSFLSSEQEFRALVFNNLGGCFFIRYEYEGNIEDLQLAVDHHTQALSLTPEDTADHSNRLSNIAAGLTHQYKHTGELQFLEKAIKLLEKAVEHGSGATLALGHLGSALLKHYEHTGDLISLQRSVEAGQEAIRLSPPDSSEVASHLNNLGLSLRATYERRGNLDDLNNSTRMFRQAISHSSYQASHLPSFLNNLGTCIWLRYNRSGDIALLDELIGILDRAVQLTPSNSPNYLRHVDNLASGLATRYRRKKIENDLDRAIELHEISVSKSSDVSPELPMRLNNLSSALSSRAKLRNDPSELDRALKLAERAVERCPPNSPELSMFLTTLGNTLAYKQANGVTDIPFEKVIETYSAAVANAPADSPDLPDYLGNLAHELGVHFDRGGSIQKELIIDHWERAAKLALNVAVESALISGKNWGDWLYKQKDWQGAIRGYAFAWEANERLFRSQIERSDKELWARETQGLSTRSAFAKAMTGDLEGAVLDLERGRARLLGEALDRDRADLELLRRTDPDLCNAYLKAVERLTQERRSRGPYIALDVRTEVVNAQAELNEIVEAIRQIPQHRDFLRPATMKDVHEAVSKLPGRGALVFVAVGMFGSVALIVANQTVEVVWPELTDTDLHSFLFTTDDEKLIGGYVPGQLTVVTMKAALAKMLPAIGERLIRPIVTRLRSMRIEHVALIAMGRLGLIPLHACSYKKRGRTISFLDEFTISYAPNARSLCLTNRTAPRADGWKLAGVGNPLPNARPLWAAEAELREVAALFPEEKAKPIFTNAATREALIDAIPDSTTVHFACHGIFNPNSPLNSFLQLSGEDKITLKDLLDGDFPLTHIQLVVLSACQTAFTEFYHLPDEVIGFPSGFLLSGVSGVVGTLWPVDDLSTALLVVKFYELLLGNAGHKRSQLHPAQALRKAQQWLRQLTPKELTRYCETHPHLNEALRLGASFERKETVVSEIAHLGSSNHPDRPFANNPYYWAPFVFVGV